MTLRQYEAFLKTVECASVSAAAQALGVSQSALTQLLAGLERDCGFPLLVRNRGGVHLTPAGKALLDQIEGRIIAVRRELLTGISQQELAQFEDIVHRISANALGKIAAQHEERE